MLDSSIKSWLYHSADNIIQAYLRQIVKHNHVDLDEVSIPCDGGLAAYIDGSPAAVTSARSNTSEVFSSVRVKVTVSPAEMLLLSAVSESFSSGASASSPNALTFAG